MNGFADIGNGVGGNADVSQGCVGTGVIGDLLDEIKPGESIRCERALVLVVDCSEECLSHGVRSHVFDAQFLPDVREDSPVGLDGQASVPFRDGKSGVSGLRLWMERMYSRRSPARSSDRVIL